jgi:hypothetical protein
MVTGSVASSLQGEPRATHDIDLVVAVKKSDSGILAQTFRPPEFHLDERSIADAIDRKGTFNLIWVSEGLKVDFWVLTEDPFDRSRFSRRYSENLTGLSVQVSSPEDTILAKLRWAKLCGGSEKQFTDALRVYEVQYDKLDLGYLTEWAERLSVESLWKRLIHEARTL